VTARRQWGRRGAFLLSVLTGALGCSESESGPNTDPAGGTGGASAVAGASGLAGAPGVAGSATMGGFESEGVCGQRGVSSVTADSFEGYEEYYLISDEGFGEDICVVRFAVTRVGEGPGGCDDCAWTHRVEYGSPEVLADVDGVCAESELALDAARVEAIAGSEGSSYGYVFEYSGHVSVLMKYDEASATWVPNGNGSWNEETGRLSYDRRDGFCGY
jgi:hypothetical protein